MHERIASAIAAHGRRRQLPEPALRRILRTRVGLTQTDVAETIGVCAPTVSRWESGATPRGSALDLYLDLLAFLATAESNVPDMHDAAARRRRAEAARECRHDEA